MTYRGHVKQGVIVLDPPAQLQEGAEFEVRAAGQPAEKGAWAEVFPRGHWAGEGIAG